MKIEDYFPQANMPKMTGNFFEERNFRRVICFLLCYGNVENKLEKLYATIWSKKLLIFFQ